jgi:hypothetical protein
VFVGPQRDALLALLLFEVHVVRRWAEQNLVMHYTESELLAWNA